MPETTTFLLVEDDPNDVLMVEMEFQRVSSHIRLLSVYDGDDAIRFLEASDQPANRHNYPVPDVILLDLKMRRIGGFEFLRWLRSQSPKRCRLIPVVVMSSSILQEDIDRAYALGANSYFVKPVDWKLFKERIRTLGIYWAEHAEIPEGHPA